MILELPKEEFEFLSDFIFDERSKALSKCKSFLSLFPAGTTLDSLDDRSYETLHFWDRHCRMLCNIYDRIYALQSESDKF